MTLLLFTQTYPFGRGEAFIESELSMLAANWPVTIVPAYGVVGAARAIPDGVSVDTSLAQRRRPRPPRSSALGSARRSALAAELRRFGPALLHPLRAAYAAHYLHRGGRAARWLLARRDSPSMILCYWSNAEAFGAALAARVDPSIRFACRAHRGDLYEDLAPAGYLPFREEIAARSRVVLAVSDDGRRHLARRHPDHVERLVTSRLCLRDGPEPIRRNPRSTSPLLASCSNDAPVKRIPLLARTLAELAARSPDRRMRWLHVGLETDRLIAALPRNVPPNLEAEGTGWIAPDAIREIWTRRAPDVFVNLSSSEGVPVSIMEALSVGMPVVATGAGGTGELVDEEVGAILPIDVAAGSAAAAIEAVLARADELGPAARRRYLARCSPESVGVEFVEHLRRHLESPGEKP